MRIFVTGTRGIPDIPGGVEKHCQELYPIIACSGHEVILATRKHYVQDKQSSWQGIQLVHLFAPHNKSLEAIVHTFVAVIKAWQLNADIIHIHAVGPSLMVPFARLLGLRVVCTNHGPDYERSTWGLIARSMLRLGECLSCRFSNELIVISSTIYNTIRQQYGRDAHLIYNGVPPVKPNSSTEILERFSIVSQKYLLTVARFVPEKGLHDLIEAFTSLQGDCQLVIAGDADHETEYSSSIKERAAQDSRIILTGYLLGSELQQLFSHARLFVMPSYHEGLPIAVLEAMSFLLPMIISSIQAHREIDINPTRYFLCGNPLELKIKIEQFLDVPLLPKELRQYRRQLRTKYNWKKIADKTISVYEQAIN